MRVLLFTGKGGVGKTTLAAATAVHAARSGVTTLLAGLAADSLADCLDRPVPGTVAQVEPRLAAVGVPGRAPWERAAPGASAPGPAAPAVSAAVTPEAPASGASWRAFGENLLGVLETLGVDDLTIDEISAVPGVEEVRTLLDLRDLTRRDGYELLVVDCPSGARALRLLALPEALNRCLELGLPVERRLLRAMATGARAVRGGESPPPRDHVVEAAERLHAALAGAREALAGPSCSVRMVLTPGAMVLAEARRQLAALALYGYVVDEVVVNLALPDGLGPADGSRAVDGQAVGGRAVGGQEGPAAEQRDALARVEASFAPAGVRCAPRMPVEPIGVGALAELAVRLYGPPGPAAVRALLDPPDPVHRLRVERDGAEYVLILPAPAAERAQMSLARAGDDLHVRLNGYRRSLTLPSGLRRCTVEGARLVDGELRVRFRPDPALWRAP